MSKEEQGRMFFSSFGLSFFSQCFNFNVDQNFAMFYSITLWRKED